MSPRGSGPGDRRRAVTPDEAALWDHATRALFPLGAKARVPASPEKAAAEPGKPSAQPKRAAASPAAPAPKPAAKATRTPPPLAALDRRKVRKIASGKVDIDARIDLHGLRQAEAARRLRSFLLDAHARGLKTVLVITGKGGEQDRSDHMAHALGEPRRGVLRRNVPLWLGEAELRGIVLGYTTAGPRHGGEGALYVELRRAERG